MVKKSDSVCQNPHFSIFKDIHNNNHLSQTPVILTMIKTVILKEVILQLNHHYNKALLLTFIMCIADVEKSVKNFAVLKHTNAPVAF